MQNLINPIQILRYDNCPICKRNSIEVFNTNNIPMNYSKAVLEYMSTGNNTQYNRTAVYKMKCRGCGKEFSIVWIDGFPRPIIEEEDDNWSHLLFLKCYKALYENKDKNEIRDYLIDIL